MKCISKILIVLAVIGIGGFAFFKANEELGLFEYENIMTEYEEKFSSMGNPIHKLITKRVF